MGCEAHKSAALKTGFSAGQDFLGWLMTRNQDPSKPERNFQNPTASAVNLNEGLSHQATRAEDSNSQSNFTTVPFGEDKDKQGKNTGNQAQNSGNNSNEGAGSFNPFENKQAKDDKDKDSSGSTLAGSGSLGSQSPAGVAFNDEILEEEGEEDYKGNQLKSNFQAAASSSGPSPLGLGDPGRGPAGGKKKSKSLKLAKNDRKGKQSLIPRNQSQKHHSIFTRMSLLIQNFCSEEKDRC